MPGYFSRRAMMRLPSPWEHISPSFARNNKTGESMGIDDLLRRLRLSPSRRRTAQLQARPPQPASPQQSLPAFSPAGFLQGQMAMVDIPQPAYPQHSSMGIPLSFHHHMQANMSVYPQIPLQTTILPPRSNVFINTPYAQPTQTQQFPYCPPTYPTMPTFVTSQALDTPLAAPSQPTPALGNEGEKTFTNELFDFLAEPDAQHTPAPCMGPAIEAMEALDDLPSGSSNGPLMEEVDIADPNLLENMGCVFLDTAPVKQADVLAELFEGAAV